MVLGQVRNKVTELKDAKLPEVFGCKQSFCCQQQFNRASNSNQQLKL
jgi:hypothetical protein